MYSQYRNFLQGAVIVFGSLAASYSAHAQSQECIDSSVVLRHKYRAHQASELQAVKQVLAKAVEGERSIAGLNDAHKRSAGERTVCETSERTCAKLFRHARQEDFSTFRRSKHYACSSNYIVYTGARDAKPTPITRYSNDKLAKKQKRIFDTINISTAWKRSHGDESVIAAVIDTGVDYTHEDLAQNVIVNFGRRFSFRNPSIDPMDDNGHGTHVAGTIAALGNNKVGVAGIAWNVKILPLKFLDADGSGAISDAIRAIDYMVALKNQGLNIRVSNNSWGGGGYSAPLHAAIISARDAGILFLAAAGNEANDNDLAPSYPASYDVENVVSVAALDTDESLAYFSNFGAASVDIAAPGVQIPSTYPGNSYAYLSGTSMAAPHVTGAAALLASYDSSLDAAGLKARLLANAKYNPEMRGNVAGALNLNVGNMLKNRTADAFAKRKTKKK